MPKEDLRLNNMRANAIAIFKAALDAVEPHEAVSRSLLKAGNELRIVSGKKIIKKIDLRTTGRIFLVGAGKASGPMAEAIEEIVGDRLSDGIVVVKTGHGINLKRPPASKPVILFRMKQDLKQPRGSRPFLRRLSRTI
jgi:glycerate 2-kinase